MIVWLTGQVEEVNYLLKPVRDRDKEIMETKITRGIS